MIYIDDIVEPRGCLNVFAARSSIAHGRLNALDLSRTRSAPGVACVLTAADIPGQNDVSPTGTNDDPCLADELVHFHGQPLFAVAAESIEEARAAAALAEIEAFEAARPSWKPSIPQG